MSFENEVVGGAGELVRNQIRSRDYVEGVSGWIIRRDGYAEFQDAVIRGILKTGTSGKYIVIDGTGSDGNKIQFFSGVPGETAPGYLLVDTSGGPPATDGFVELAAPSISGGDVPKLNLNSTNPDSGANASITSPGSISIAAAGVAEISGALINMSSAGDITVQPNGDFVIDGTPATLSNTAGDLVINPASGTISLAQGQRVKRGGKAALNGSYQNSWSDFGGNFETGGYIEMPDHFGELVGVLSAGTVTSGTLLFTLPVQMRPAKYHVFIVGCNGGRKAQLQVQSDGQVIFQNPDAGVTWMSMGGCRWPISGF